MHLQQRDFLSKVLERCLCPILEKSSLLKNMNAIKNAENFKLDLMGSVSFQYWGWLKINSEKNFLSFLSEYF